MSDVLGSDLHKRVERYEVALRELHASQQDVRDVLLPDVLFDRWRQLGADLGFATEVLSDGRFRTQPNRDLVTSSSDIGKSDNGWDN